MFPGFQQFDSGVVFGFLVFIEVYFRILHAVVDDQNVTGGGVSKENNSSFQSTKAFK